MNGIVWLASYPKSGNTWLRIFIENLFRDTREPASIDDLRIVKYADNVHALYAMVAGRPTGGMTDEELHRLREPLQRFFATQPETSFVKTHNAFGMAGGLPLIHARYTKGAVYLLRNPFDMAVSYAHHYRIGPDDAIEAIASPHNRVETSRQAVFQLLGRWGDHYRGWMGAEGFAPLLLRYEDMARRPAKAFGRFADYLGLPRNPERLRRAIRHSGFAEAARQERASGFKERSRPDQVFFRSGRIGAYREALSEAQIGRIVDAHGEVLLEQRYISRDGRPRV